MSPEPELLEGELDEPEPDELEPGESELDDVELLDALDESELLAVESLVSDDAPGDAAASLAPPPLLDERLSFL